MSEPAAKPRPMIDLDEFERRLRRPAAAPQSHDDPLAELARLVGGHEDPFKSVFERDGQSPKPPGAAPPVFPAASRAQPVTEPNLDDDFATFAEGEPQLLGTIDPQAYGRQEPQMAVQQGYSGAPAETQDFDWSAPAAPQRQMAEAPRSRKPLFVMAAIIAVGIMGIGVSFAYKSKSAPHEIATIKAMTGPTKIAPDSPGGTAVPNQDASILDKAPQPTPSKLADHSEQPVDLAAQQTTAPARVVMANAGSAASAPAAAQSAAPNAAPPSAAPQDIQSYGIGALIEPKKVKTISVGSDGKLLPNDTPPQMPQSAPPASAPAHAVAPPPAAAATTPKPAAIPKSTARIVTTPKPAQTIDQLTEANDAPAAPAAPAQTPAKPVVKPKPMKIASTEAISNQETKPATDSAEGGAFAVQFAAPGSEEEAHQMTARLAQKFGGDLSGHHLTYHRAKVGDKTVFRIRASGMSRDEATGICEKVKSNGGSCFVAKS